MDTPSLSFIQIELEERTVRNARLKGPDYWSGDLAHLEALHATTAQNLQKSFSLEGWPTIPMVGWDEARAALQVVTRCISCPDFMLQCLPLIEQSYRFGGIPGDWFAEFYDTVMYFKGKPQIFGTFLDWNEKLDCDHWKILEREELDRRRGHFGLDSFAEDSARRMSQWKSSCPTPPKDFISYTQAREIWSKRVGWVQ